VEDVEEIIAPFLLPGEKVEETFASVVLTDRQAIVLTTRLGGGLRNPFTRQAAGFPYGDIQTVLVTSISAAREKNVVHLVEIGTSASPARGAPTEDQLRAVKFSNGWSDPKAADDSYAEKPNVIRSGTGPAGRDMAARTAAAINARIAPPLEAAAPTESAASLAAASAVGQTAGRAIGAFTKSLRNRSAETTSQPSGGLGQHGARLAAALRDGLQAARNAETQVSADQKLCPDCAEAVKAQANVCRYCGYRFDGRPAA
jgi:hypothetical protein